MMTSKKFAKDVSKQCKKHTKQNRQAQTESQKYDRSKERRGPQRFLTIVFQEFLLKGHGVYKEIPSEKDFFDEIKNSKRAVVHFYRPTTDRCTIFDKHLEIIAPKYLEARFVKLNAEKAPFLCERLNIRVIPTLLLIVDGQTKVIRQPTTLKNDLISIQEKVVGFDQLGGHDHFSTEMLEWRLGVSKVINYKGDLSQPPGTSD